MTKPTPFAGLPIIGRTDVLYSLPSTGYFKDDTQDHNYKILHCLQEGPSSNHYVVQIQHGTGEGPLRVAQLYRQSEDQRVSKKHALLSGLTHPSIPKLTDYGRSSLSWQVDLNGEFQIFGPFLVTELNRGQPLASALESETKLSLAQILDVFLQVCGSFEYVHLREIIHGSFTTENIFITPNSFETGKLDVQILGWGNAYLRSASIHPAGAEMFLYSASEFAVIPPERRMEGHAHLALPQWDIYALGKNLNAALYRGAYLLTEGQGSSSGRLSSLDREILTARFQKKISYAKALERLKDVILRMGDSNPIARPDLSEIQKVLSEVIAQVSEIQGRHTPAVPAPSEPIVVSTPTLPMDLGSAPVHASTASTLVIETGILPSDVHLPSSTPTVPMVSSVVPPVVVPLPESFPHMATTMVIPQDDTPSEAPSSYQAATTEVIDTRQRPRIADPNSPLWARILRRIPFVKRFF